MKMKNHTQPSDVSTVAGKRKVRPLHRDHKMTLRWIGENLKAARLKTGASMGTMSKLSGVSKGRYSNIENGANLTVLTLYKMCWSIGIHPRDVLPGYRSNEKARTNE